MCSRSALIVAVVLLCVAMCVHGAVHAQTIHFSVEDIALRNGESVEFGNLYLIGPDCKSLLTSEPEVEVMDRPPGVAVAVTRAMVVPYEYGCRSSVMAGKLLISAHGVVEYSYSRMTLRFRYKTTTGSLQRSQHINLALFP